MGVGKEISKLLYLEKSCTDFETLLHALRGRGAMLSHNMGFTSQLRLSNLVRWLLSSKDIEKSIVKERDN